MLQEQLQNVSGLEEQSYILTYNTSLLLVV